MLQYQKSVSGNTDGANSMAWRAGLCGLLARHQSPHARSALRSDKAKCRAFVEPVPATIYMAVFDEVAPTLCSPQVETVLGRERERVAEQSRFVGAAESSLARNRAAVPPAGRQHPGDFQG
ncbi:MAG: hypothetical protein KME26_33495 [Oscillatoria princeps RMCB-10]|nr:hypothetical protein [Oscillatoria princeps RMCB-10]